MAILTMLLIGLVAAIIDVTPMVLQKLPTSACISAGIHWVVLGVLIPSVQWDMLPWVKGILIALMALLPVAVLVWEDDKKALIPMVIFSIILGAGVGLAGDAFIQ